MSIFDNALNKAKDTAEVAGKKTASFVNLQKLKMKHASLNVKLAKLFEALGKVCYNEPEATVDSTAELRMKIDMMIANIKQVAGEIALAKGQRICPNCSAINAGDADFCNRCGTKMACDIGHCSIGAVSSDDE